MPVVARPCHIDRRSLLIGGFCAIPLIDAHDAKASNKDDVAARSVEMDGCMRTGGVLSQHRESEQKH